MYIVDSGASFGRSFTLSAGKENRTTDQKRLEDPNPEWHRLFRPEGEGYIQELGTHFFVKLVGDSPSILSLGRLCDDLGFSYSWKPGGNSTLTKGKNTITCRPTTSFLSSRSSSRRSLHLSGTTPPGETPCLLQKWWQPRTHCWGVFCLKV